MPYAIRIITQNSETSYAPDQSTQEALDANLTAQMTAILTEYSSPEVINFEVDRSKSAGVRLYLLIKYT